MLLNKIEYKFKHENRYYWVTYNAISGFTTITVDYGEEIKEVYMTMFVCDDRKAAEIFLMGYINHEKRKG